MADFLHDNVFNAALAVVEACDGAEVRATGSSVLVSAVTLNAGNYSQGAGSPTGRRTQCLVSSASDMKAISVDTGGAATKVALIDSATTIVLADLPSTVSLGSSDQVNLGTFYVQFPDAT